MAKESTKDQVKGKGYEIKGKIKQKASRALSIFELEEIGEEEEIAGKVQKTIGQITRVFES